MTEQSKPAESFPQTTSESPSTPETASARIVSIDAYRGMVMFLMLAEVLHLYRLSENYPGIPLLEWIRFHTTHVDWEGCSLHDLIQPGFTFLVGVAMPFSIASRMKRHQSSTRMLWHAAWRSIVLIGLGIILRSLGREQTYFTFEDTLTQIGLGYFIVFLIALAPRWVHYASAAAVLILFWGAYAVGPTPPPDFDYAAVGVPEDWPHHDDGFSARWNKNSNLSWQADVWFLNLFPVSEPFKFNSGGYATVSFVPTMFTMLFGLIAGVWLKQSLNVRKRLLRFVAAIGLGIGLGWLLAWLEICPSVKRIWTPSFALFSGGCCMAWLLTLHLICDLGKLQSWVFPFVVIGANSILIYVMSWTLVEPIHDLLLRHLGTAPFAIFGDPLVEQMLGLATLSMMFYILLWLYRRRVFVKI